jgi:hypothetical protein
MRQVDGVHGLMGGLTRCDDIKLRGGVAETWTEHRGSSQRLYRKHPKGRLIEGILAVNVPRFPGLSFYERATRPTYFKRLARGAVRGQFGWRRVSGGSLDRHAFTTLASGRSLAHRGQNSRNQERKNTV